MGDRVRRLMRDAKAAETAAAFREDLDVHDADLHEGVADPSQPHEHDGVTHAHAANPYRSGDGGWIADRIDREWTPVLQDLLELEAAGALGGIRAVIAERLRQVREGEPDGFAPKLDRYTVEIFPGRGTAPLALTAALLAAEIDRQQAGGTRETQPSAAPEPEPLTRRELTRLAADHKRDCRECHMDGAGRAHRCWDAEVLITRLQRLADTGQ